MQSHREELRLDFKNTANIGENDVSYDSVPLGGNLLRFLKTTAHSWGGTRWRCKVFTHHLTPASLVFFQYIFQDLAWKHLHICHLDVQKIICVFLFGQSRGSTVAWVMKGG